MDIGGWATRGIWVNGIMDKLDADPVDDQLSYNELMSAAGHGVRAPDFSCAPYVVYGL